MSINHHQVELALVPLKLPGRGEDLHPGRQYYIDPVARHVILHEFGIVCPKTVECLDKKRPATRLTMISENLETGVKTEHVTDNPATSAKFRAFYKHKRIEIFTLDLSKVEERRQFYQDADVVKDEDEVKQAEKLHKEKKASASKPKVDPAVMALINSII